MRLVTYEHTTLHVQEIQAFPCPALLSMLGIETLYQCLHQWSFFTGGHLACH